MAKEPFRQLYWGVEAFEWGAQILTFIEGVTRFCQFSEGRANNNHKN